MSSIFISYSRKDQAYVKKIIEALEARQLPVWLDSRTNYGAKWAQIIQSNLEKSKVFLLVMSPRSRNSIWVANELIHALKCKKPIFPILLEGEIWMDVASIQTFDATGGKLPCGSFFTDVSKYFPDVDSDTHSTIGTSTFSGNSGESTNLSIYQGQLSEGLQVPQIQIRSDVDIEYDYLEDLLRKSRWKEGDVETQNIIRSIFKKHVSFDDPESFPLKDLYTIDSLWTVYSEGLFGFKVQREIYIQCGGDPRSEYKKKTPPEPVFWDQFCDKIGWRRNGQYASHSKIYELCEVASGSNKIGLLPYACFPNNVVYKTSGRPELFDMSPIIGKGLASMFQYEKKRAGYSRYSRAWLFAHPYFDNKDIFDQ